MAPASRAAFRDVPHFPGKPADSVPALPGSGRREWGCAALKSGEFTLCGVWPDVGVPPTIATSATPAFCLRGPDLVSLGPKGIHETIVDFLGADCANAVSGVAG